MSTHILIMAPLYPPFVKGGGPIRSIYNLVNALSNDYSFSVITGDRDLGDSVKPAYIKADEWLDAEGTRVLYTPAARLSPIRLVRLLRQANADVIYCNSFFSYRFSILPVLMSRLGLVPGRFVLAPRGEFSPGALGLKARKKHFFLCLAKAIKLHKSVTWHATTEDEAKLIRKVIQDHPTVIVAPNLVEPPSQTLGADYSEKAKGQLKIVFVSRITRKKNLKFALQSLEGVRGNFEFDIYGPIEDRGYWRECEELARSLCSEHEIRYLGPVPHSDIPRIFRNAQVFLFPTLGENFGHVIYESLASGCPVITSDQTPWIDLANWGAGHALSLGDPAAFTRRIQELVDLPPHDYRRHSLNAMNFARYVAESSRRDHNYNALFSGLDSNEIS